MPSLTLTPKINLHQVLSSTLLNTATAQRCTKVAIKYGGAFPFWTSLLPLLVCQYTVVTLYIEQRMNTRLNHGDYKGATEST